MTILAVWAGIFAIGLFVVAIQKITKGFFGQAIVFALLAFALGGACGAFAAAA
jgi:hypothetical protein